MTLFGGSYANTIKKAGESMAEFERLSASIGEQLKVVAEKQRALTDAEGRQADAIADGMADSASQKRIDTARAELDKATALMSGLRRKLLAVVGRMPELWNAITENLPQQEADLRATFIQEWDGMIAQVKPVLARRAAVEGILGRLELEKLTAPPADMASVSPAHALLPRLADCVRRLSADGGRVSALLTDDRCPAAPGVREEMAGIKASQEKVEGADYQRKARRAAAALAGE
jgi:hypothetical protein